MKAEKSLSRRSFLKLGSFGVLGAVAANLIPDKWQGQVSANGSHEGSYKDHNAHKGTGTHGAPSLSGSYDPKVGGLDPGHFLTSFDYGNVSMTADGRTAREYQIVAEDKEVEIAPGVKFPGWVFNGQIPGPTLRCTEGDLVRVHFTNKGSHPHNIHFHGMHPSGMDGIDPIPPGGTFVYEFTAEPFGLHLYHCHVLPFKKHINRGLYGTFIVDPKTPRPQAHEMVMVMNGYDLDGDAENEFYTVNGVAFYYHSYPIEIKQDELVRIYLVNMTEFDLLNSFHLHGNLFHYFPTGTSLTPSEYTDTIMLTQGQRGILEFKYKFPGTYMFHAHQSEFTELGWSGFFQVK
ncbi:multicopper oxidase domain-containing protein [Effusibacillus lacus]|uniref:Copper-containing nitrite reductase n=1 Tax=Effusibacillus lacus TaxID=1348429 RepID=A0A292YRV5_9BACL|nr:multicopper oxidase domain-containing protein [Effusibacillus lacus]TCS74992.1 FtsP/CotA-like multicopper oxidase with cupredoxin domain [Effusibacillus lacus]GAX91659.1 copper oxidase [Effusibacillus lacus]